MKNTSTADLEKEYKELLKARQQLNYRIREIKRQLRGAAAKESFRLTAELLNIDQEFFEKNL